MPEREVVATTVTNAAPATALAIQSGGPRRINPMRWSSHRTGSTTTTSKGRARLVTPDARASPCARPLQEAVVHALDEVASLLFLRRRQSRLQPLGVTRMTRPVRMV